MKKNEEFWKTIFFCVWKNSILVKKILRDSCQCHCQWACKRRMRVALVRQSTKMFPIHFLFRIELVPASRSYLVYTCDSNKTRNVVISMETSGSNCVCWIKKIAQIKKKKTSNIDEINAKIVLTRCPNCNMRNLVEYFSCFLYWDYRRRQNMDCYDRFSPHPFQWCTERCAKNVLALPVTSSINVVE